MWSLLWRLTLRGRDPQHRQSERNDEPTAGENRTQWSLWGRQGTRLYLPLLSKRWDGDLQGSGCPSSQSCPSTWPGIASSRSRCCSGSWRAVRPDCRSMLPRRASRSSLPGWAAAVSAQPWPSSIWMATVSVLPSRSCAHLSCVQCQPRKGVWGNIIPASLNSHTRSHHSSPHVTLATLLLTTVKLIADLRFCLIWCNHPKCTKNMLTLSSKEDMKSLYPSLGDVHFSSESHSCFDTL